MAQALWMRLREEAWEDYTVAEGKADRLPKVLQDLASRKRARAMKASHDIWRMLCRGEVQSAAVIVVPYLIEILEISLEDVQMEICDTLKSCACGAEKSTADWAPALREILLETEPTLRGYAKRARGDAAIALAGLLDALESLRNSGV